jgi:hypothetical protein
MSSDPVVYDAVKHKHPSLCSACIHRQGDDVQMLSGYCITASRCDGCRRTADLAMCVIRKPLVMHGTTTRSTFYPYTNKVDIPHTSCGIRDLKNRLIEHTAAENCGSLEDEQMAAGRVIDAIKALPLGDWVVLCKALKKGLP